MIESNENVPTSAVVEKRTLVVGLDAACWEYLDPLVMDGRMPNLAGLLARGAWGRLRSTMPPITPAAWSSLITGVNPGKHGIFDWVQRQPGSYRFSPVAAGSRVGTPFWRRLNQAGVRTGVVNLPLTYPPQPLDGFMLCGFSAPPSARDLTYPADLFSQMEKEIGPYAPTVARSAAEREPEEFYEALRTHQEQTVSAAISLYRSRPVHVLAINLMLIDHANHGMPGMDLVEQAMMDTDADLGRLLAEMEPDNVLVLSDHGSRRVKGVFLLNAWLADQGFLVRQRRSAPDRARTINFLLEQWLNGRGHLLALRRRLLREVLERFPGRLAPVQRAIERDIPLAFMQADTVDELVPSGTRAYPTAGNRGCISLNLAGREPEGIVSATESEAVLEELLAAMGTISDPNSGEPLFAHIHRPEEVYTGPFVSQSPDLIGDYYQSEWSVVSTVPGLHRRPWRYFVTGERWHGDHAKDGLYVLAGSEIQHNPADVPANLLDIAPTLLYLHGVPLPDDYDGQPLPAALQAVGRPICYQPGDRREMGAAGSTFTRQEEQEVLDRLAQLGYVDA